MFCNSLLLFNLKMIQWVQLEHFATFVELFYLTLRGKSYHQKQSILFFSFFIITINVIINIIHTVKTFKKALLSSTFLILVCSLFFLSKIDTMYYFTTNE